MSVKILRKDDGYYWLDVDNSASRAIMRLITENSIVLNALDYEVNHCENDELQRKLDIAVEAMELLRRGEQPYGEQYWVTAEKALAAIEKVGKDE